MYQRVRRASGHKTAYRVPRDSGAPHMSQRFTAGRDGRQSAQTTPPTTLPGTRAGSAASPAVGATSPPSVATSSPATEGAEQGAVSGALGEVPAEEETAHDAMMRGLPDIMHDMPDAVVPPPIFIAVAVPLSSAIIMKVHGRASHSAAFEIDVTSTPTVVKAAEAALVVKIAELAVDPASGTSAFLSLFPEGYGSVSAMMEHGNIYTGIFTIRTTRDGFAWLRTRAAEMLDLVVDCPMLRSIDEAPNTMISIEKKLADGTPLHAASVLAGVMLKLLVMFGRVIPVLLQFAPRSDSGQRYYVFKCSPSEFNQLFAHGIPFEFGMYKPSIFTSKFATETFFMEGTNGRVIG